MEAIHVPVYGTHITNSPLHFHMGCESPKGKIIRLFETNELNIDYRTHIINRTNKISGEATIEKHMLTRPTMTYDKDNEYFKHCPQ